MTMRVPHLVMALALFASVAGCGKGPQGEQGPAGPAGPKGDLVRSVLPGLPDRLVLRVKKARRVRRGQASVSSDRIGLRTARCSARTMKSCLTPIAGPRAIRPGHECFPLASRRCLVWLGTTHALYRPILPRNFPVAKDCESAQLRQGGRAWCEIAALKIPLRLYAARGVNARRLIAPTSA